MYSESATEATPGSAGTRAAASGSGLNTVRLLRLAERELRAAGADERLVRICVPVEAVDPLAWLSRQRLPERFYWQARDEATAWAAVGAADVIANDDALARLERRIQSLARGEPRLRYAGGMRFRPEQPPAPEWRPFGAWRFVLPRFELEVAADEAVLTLNLVLPRDSAVDIRALIAELRQPHEVSASPPVPVTRTSLPDLPGWRDAVRTVLAAVDGGQLEKVVLARRVTYGFEEPLDPVCLLRSLRSVVPRAFHFLVQPNRTAAFVGASPERLYHWRQGAVRTEAVAGTRPRHANPRRDADLRDELVASGKDLREHRHVLEHLLAAFDGSSDRIEVEPTEVMDLTSNRHLRTPIEVLQANSSTPLDLLGRLHPTPAVAGVPLPAALERIASLDPFDRGWYAGPVGWVGAYEAEFAVAIRSGLVRQNGDGATLDLFSGAGIVAGSEADAEWDELEQKIADFVQVLGLERG